MKVRLIILLILALFVVGLKKVDNITNMYLGKTNESLGESIKNDITNILSLIPKK